MVKTILWGLFVVPWLSLIFLKGEQLRRFMPVALLATVINSIIGQMANEYDWWRFKESIFAWDKMMPLYTVYGMFLAGTIWIFVFTFGKFWVYMIVNAIIDSIYGFGLARWLNALEVRETGKITPLANLSLMLFIAVLLYGYQLWQEGRIGGRKRAGSKKRGHDEKNVIFVREKMKAR
ncbi:hypothetical protein [Paenibacillus turpanensis]|uniref:hypothetical protein n=1 Tax=Paenibacillus turpanensis TaxID=2689078 RepID=UPI00140C20A8|nr:hypothetical protein [Paenibacillus turpanensis]